MWHTDKTIHDAHVNEILRVASIQGEHNRCIAALRSALALSSTSELTDDRFRSFIGVLTMAALDVWVEIKGAKATEKDLEKPRLLALSGDCAVVVYWGAPRIAWPKETGVIYGWTEKGFTEAVPCGAFCTAEKGLSFDLMDTVYTSSDMSCEVPSISPSNKIQGNLFEATKRAIEAARGSRFEHGEVPRV